MKLEFSMRARKARHHNYASLHDLNSPLQRSSSRK